MLLEKLVAAGIGSRPVVFVTHRLHYLIVISSLLALNKTFFFNFWIKYFLFFWFIYNALLALSAAWEAWLSSRCYIKRRLKILIIL